MKEELVMKAIRIVALLVVIAAAVALIVFQAQREKTRRAFNIGKLPGARVSTAPAATPTPTPPPPPAPKAKVYDPSTLTLPIQVVTIFPERSGEQYFGKTIQVLNKLAKEFPGKIEVKNYGPSERIADDMLREAGLSRPGCVLINGYVTHRLKQNGKTKEVTFNWGGMLNPVLNYQESDLEAVLRQYLKRATPK
jgi:hypothetical protein